MFSRFMIWSIIVPVSIAFGAVLGFAAPAVYPPSSSIAWPIACPGGEVTVESQNYSYRPGQSGIARTLWCQTSDHDPPRDITMKTLGLLFLIYTLLSAVALRFLILPWVRRRLTGALTPSPEEAPDASGYNLSGLVDDIVRQAHEAGVTVSRDGEEPTPAPPAGPAERLAILKQMRDQGLIGPEDYEAKKAEILRDL
jgi:hypothetical protein